jgi:RHS repeat-associated protein
MNGRTYDTRLGRFMQADIAVQSPFETQSYNRYSYLRNNPLNGTDPTSSRVSTSAQPLR